MPVFCFLSGARTSGLVPGRDSGGQRTFLSGPRPEAALEVPARWRVVKKEVWGAVP